MTVTKWYLADFFYSLGQKDNSLNSSLLAFQFDPINPNFSIQLGSFYATKNQSNLAIYYINKAQNVSSFEINFYKQASIAYTNLALHNISFLSQAIEKLQAAQIFAPTDAVIPYQLGNLYKAINDSDKAQEYYLQALSLKPNYDHAMLQLGQLYFEQKNYSKAKELFDSAIKINPKNSQSLPSFPPHL